MVPMKKDNEQAGGRYPLMQEMRISQLVLDPTSHVDSKNLEARSSPCLAGEHAARERDQMSDSSG